MSSTTPPTLTEYVRANIDPQVYYDSIFPDLHWPAGSEARTTCPFHDDGKTPSMHFNPITGKWFCHGCSKGGNSIVSFHAALQGQDGDEGENRHEQYVRSCVDLYDKFIRPVVPDEKVKAWRDRLLKTPSVVGYLRKQRYLTNEVIAKYELGWNGRRIALPIRNEFGLCVNVKFYDPQSSEHESPKWVSYRERKEDGGDPTRKYAGEMLYPLDVMPLAEQLGYVVVCEGEFDALALTSMGIPAVSSTNGSKSWPKQYSKRFRGLMVIIAYDNDKDGINYAKKVVLKRLRKYAKVIKRLTIPMIETAVKGKFTKDVTDWIGVDSAMREPDAWIDQIDQARVLLENPDEFIEATEQTQVPLDEASQAKWYNKQIRVQGLVTGKDVAPYILPKLIRASCNKSCDHCPMAQLDKDHKEVSLDPHDPRVLSLIDQNENVVRRHLLSLSQLGEKPSCQGRVEVLETFNVEQLLLIPGLDERSTQYVMRPAYFVGHGLSSNRTYNFDGTTAIHPQDQHSTHLFWAAKPVQDQVETFSPDPTTIEALRRTFSTDLPTTRSLDSEGERGTTTIRSTTSPNPSSPPFTSTSPSPRSPRARINGHGVNGWSQPHDPSNAPRSLLPELIRIAEWQSRNVTKIRQRSDLHVGVDLVFHSVPGFTFNGEYVKRGMLDVLIVGDTRCGKGYVSEGLMKYYGLGEMASGESCSFAGLVGGIDEVGRRRVVKWGIIPLNNGRLVIVDEASSLSDKEIGHMSRVRSEGVAEINKIITERTPANVRLLWLANPRSGLPMAKHDSGLQVIKELVGANEDIARYDFALTVATSEVQSEVINERRDLSEESDRDLYPADLCRQLVLWAWSRRPDQVHFTPGATDEIIRQAIKFGRTYSPEVPLVQAENIRIKLAKISAAVAARLFASPDGETLQVDTAHVLTACEYLHQIYRKPSMAYDRFSRQKNSTTTVKNVDTIDELFSKLGGDQVHAMTGLLNNWKITPDALADYVGDVQSAKGFIGDLVRLNCLMRIETDNRPGGTYLKNPKFSQWLRDRATGPANFKESSNGKVNRVAGRRARGVN